MIKTKKGKINFFTINIVILLGLGFLLRIILSPFGTLSLDQNTFLAWSLRLNQVGFSKFYFGAWSDYLPGYLYVLNFLGQVNKLNIIPFTMLYKLPAIISDVATSYLIYKIVRKFKNQNWAKISAALYLFNPAVFANSSLWGQVDGLVSFFSLLAIYLLDINFYISAIALAIGTLIKPQMAIISLIILILMITRKWDIKKIILYISISAITFILGFLPFSSGNNLINFIIARLTLSLNQYPYTSVNAFNFWEIIGGWKLDTTFNIVGAIIVLILFFTFGLKFLKQKGGEYILLAFTFAISFLFMTRMHERHMLPLFAPLTIAVALNPVFIFALIGSSFIYLANLYWAWVWVTNNFREVFGQSAVKLLSFINLLLISFFLLPKEITNSLFQKTRRLTTKSEGASFRKANVFEKTSLSSQKIKILFIGVVIFASITRFYNLGNPQTHYFDEVYHAFTAQNMLHGVTKAWEWWNPNPTGFAYEWTHPPVAKELMALSMKFLGENSFGWRFPGAILGSFSVILIFFITKELFSDELTGLIASIVFALDGLPLVLSRIGMNDSYVLFFSLSAIFSYLKKKNLFASIFLGFALASKWSALWVIPIILVAHFVLKRKLNLTYTFFFIIPIIIYISTYFPLFTNNQIQKEYITNNYYETKPDKTGIVPLDIFIDTQKQMWWYHTRLKATHPYTSMWYTWPFLIRPIYLYTSDEVKGNVARIYAMGNPIVFWGGTLAIITSSYVAFKERNKKLGFVIFSYLVFFTPWAISPRIMFLYHYLPSVPFMAITIAYLLRRFRQWMVPFFALALIAFIYFYPHWIGLTIPLQLDASYYWFPSWR